MRSDKERFEEKYTVSKENKWESSLGGDDSPCWDWTASVSKYGYSKFKYQGKDTTGHRFSYLHSNGFPDLTCDDEVCHKCRNNRKCVNPHHLYLGTAKDNAADRDLHGNTARGERSGAVVAIHKRPRGEQWHANMKGKKKNPRSGEASNCSKLSNADVIDIRRRRALPKEERPTCSELAQEKGCSDSLILAIAKGTRRRHG